MGDSILPGLNFCMCGVCVNYNDIYNLALLSLYDHYGFSVCIYSQASSGCVFIPLQSIWVNLILDKKDHSHKQP